jgi:hypothetical protein
MAQRALPAALASYQASLALPSGRISRPGLDGRGRTACGIPPAMGTRLLLWGILGAGWTAPTAWAQPTPAPAAPRGVNGAKGREYATEVPVFRQAVEDLAATPEGAAALARFTAGDELGALGMLDDLRAGRNRGRGPAAAVASAAEGRQIATLALEAMRRGKLSAAAVAVRFEELTELDPGVHWDWVELGRLYQVLGRLPDALRAAERAAATAETTGTGALRWARSGGT